MTRFKNVDIKDLQNILQNGILPISVTGNRNWTDGRRVDNSEDVVYLFERIEGQNNVFPQYGMALLAVQVDGATQVKMDPKDVNNGLYKEFVIDKVKPDEIVAVYIPRVFKDLIAQQYQLHDERIHFIKITAKVFSHAAPAPTKENPWKMELFYRPATSDELQSLVHDGTVALNSSELNFFRGVNAKNEVVDFVEVEYLID